MWQRNTQVCHSYLRNAFGLFQTLTAVLKMPIHINLLKPTDYFYVPPGLTSKNFTWWSHSSSSSSRRWIFFNCWQFWPPQLPPPSISLDPGRKLSNFWSSFGKCPVWCYPPICTWVFLVIFGHGFPIKYLLNCSAIWHSLHVTKPA
jgi:hypothetical protein